MPKQRNNIGLSSVLLLALTLAGCATQRNYSGPVHGLTFNGTVQSIDPQNHRLTLTPLKPSEPVVFILEGATRFWKDGIPITPESIEPTWPVRVHYHTSEGQIMAHHVYVQTRYPITH